VNLRISYKVSNKGTPEEKKLGKEVRGAADRIGLGKTSIFTFLLKY